MLASKAYAAPVNLPAPQASAPSYHTGSSQKLPVGAKPQDGVLFTSPTESEFSDPQGGLEAIRSVPQAGELVEYYVIAMLT